MKAERDNEIYKAVKIGEQIWLAENLRYNILNDSWCYRNETANCEKYGRLYNWYAAIKVAPKGWHLPSDKEWDILIDELGGEKVAGSKMKEKGLKTWAKSNNGATNSSGFLLFLEVVFGGVVVLSIVRIILVYGGVLPITVIFHAYYRELLHRDPEVYRISGNKSDGCSVRCVKDVD